MSDEKKEKIIDHSKVHSNYEDIGNREIRKRNMERILSLAFQKKQSYEKNSWSRISIFLKNNILQVIALFIAIIGFALILFIEIQERNHGSHAQKENQQLKNQKNKHSHKRPSTKNYQKIIKKLQKDVNKRKKEIKMQNVRDNHNQVKKKIENSKTYNEL